MTVDQFCLFLFGKPAIGCKFPGKNIQHVIVLGIFDEGTALLQNTVESCITHKISCFGFLAFIGEETLKIWFYGGQKIQVVRDILIFIKSIFCQKDRQLRLDAKTGT